MKLSVLDHARTDTIAKRRLIERIIAAYSGIIRLYCYIRFKIIRLRFLEEIEQYLPNRGEIVDLGCGFGLFALYMAARKPRAHVIGVDANEKRLRIARTIAGKLGIENVSFAHQDLRQWRPDQPLAAVYALDVLHHVDADSGNRLLHDLFARIEPGGRLVLKDIDTVPRLMLWFTYVLDVLMSPRDALCYRSAGEWRERLAETGFAPIYVHYLWDILPYPHILIVCNKPSA